MNEVIPPVTPPAVSTETPAAPPSQETPQSENWENKYKELDNQFRENQRLIENANAFLRDDSEARERLQLWTKSYSENKPYTELLNEWQSKRTPTTTKREDSAGLTEKKIQEILESRLRSELDSRLGPVNQQLSRMDAERDAQAILKANSWAKQEHLVEFDSRLNKMVQERAMQELNNNWPRMSREQAEKKAWAAYADLDTNLLFQTVMQDKRDEYIVSGKRPAPSLPQGMGENISSGVEPALLDKVKSALGAAEGDGKKVAEIIKEYAPQFGVNPDDKEAVVSLWAKLSK